MLSDFSLFFQVVVLNIQSASERPPTSTSVTKSCNSLGAAINLFNLQIKSGFRGQFRFGFLNPVDDILVIAPFRITFNGAFNLIGLFGFGIQYDKREFRVAVQVAPGFREFIVSDHNGIVVQVFQIGDINHIGNTIQVGSGYASGS